MLCLLEDGIKKRIQGLTNGRVRDDLAGQYRQLSKDAGLADRLEELERAVICLDRPARRSRQSGLSDLLPDTERTRRPAQTYQPRR